MKKLMRKKLALMLANLKKKRPFFCEVEYLESTGTQYINTGITGGSGTKAEIKCFSTNTTSNKALFGARDASTYYNSFTIWQTANNKIRFDYSADSSSVQLTIVWDPTVPHILKKDGRYNYIDGVQQTSNGEKTFSCNYTFSLFGVNTGGTTAGSTCLVGRVYYCRIWNGSGSLVRDLIPVLDWNYTPCMYDKVTGQFFYNQGTGTFQYGREIHYVDYLESTGEQYIDTAVNASSGLCCDMDVSFTDKGYASASVVFGGRTELLKRFGWGLADGANALWDLAVVNDTYSNPNISPDLNTKYNVYFYSDNSGARLDVDGIALISTTSVVSQTINAWLFGWNYNGTNQWPFKGKIYYAKLYNNGTLVRDFLPAIDSNGVGFMLDKVTHTIYDNAGTGSFVVPTYQVDGNGHIEEPRYE